jgi:Mg-chelatase subunit ChlI
MSSAFTAREMTLLACAFRAMETIPKINYAKMAELAGMSNHNSAANAWREIRKKIDAVDGTAEAMTDVTTPKTLKATGRKRKTKDADEDDDSETEFTPKKKRGRRPAATKETGNDGAEKKTPGPKKGARKSTTPKEVLKTDGIPAAKEEDEGLDPNMEEPEFAAYDDGFGSAEEV